MAKWKYFEEAKFIFNGGTEDPELQYKGATFDYYLIEDSVYESFKEYAEEEDILDNEENFVFFCKENSGMIRELFELNMQ